MIKRSAAILLSAALSVTLSSCGKSKNSVTTGNITRDFSERSEAEKNFSFNTDGISILDISQDIGDISITYSDSDITELKLSCKSFADDKEVCEDVLSHISADTDMNGGKMVISFVDEDSGEEISQWLSENIPDSRIELDAELTVPSYINDFTAKVNVGNISLIGLKGAVSAYADVGNITCCGSEISSSSALGCNTGNVELSSNVYTADISVNIYAGNTTFQLPEKGSENAEIQISSKTGRIHIITEEKEHSIKDERKENNSHALSIEAQGCNIEASAETGIITIDQEDQ